MPQIMKNFVFYTNDSLEMPQGSGLIYEVIRVIDGSALFFREHYDRFVNSGATSAMGAPLTYSSFLEMTVRFIQSLGKLNFNVKVILDPTTQDLYLFENPSAYPERSLYETGVSTELLTYLRKGPQCQDYKSGTHRSGQFKASRNRCL